MDPQEEELKRLHKLEEEKVRVRYFTAQRLFERLKASNEDPLPEIRKDEELDLIDCRWLMLAFVIEPYHLYLIAASHGATLPEGVIEEYLDYHHKLDYLNLDKESKDEKSHIRTTITRPRRS